jgi:SAM-dependent methyltransferase
MASAIRWNQEVYQEVIERMVTADTRWLDAGCGWHVFPEWQLAAERAVVSRARLAVGCDVDEQLGKHRTFRHLASADVSSLPFRDASFTLVTLNMVIEHLDAPAATFAELARVLRPGGRVVVHTPNALSYFALSHWIPRGFKLRLLDVMGDGRAPVDIFPTRYRANRVTKLRRLMAGAGLAEEWCEMLVSGQSVPRRWPRLFAMETWLLQALSTPPGRPFRASILAAFRKRGGGPDSQRAPAGGGAAERPGAPDQSPPAR